MLIYQEYNSYDKEDFIENKKFSCHSWLFMCIDNISNCFYYIEKNSSYINNKDLVGKYNALNYLLDIFSYHQCSNFRDYPLGRNHELDFSLILYGLLEENGDVQSLDYQRKSFLENLNAVLVSQETITWKQKKRFLNNQTIELCFGNNKKNIIKELLSNEKRPNYLGLTLEFELNEKEQINKKIKM